MARSIFGACISSFSATGTALGMSADWHALQFRGMPPIKHSVKGGKITLEVKSSAGGLVRSLPKGTRVKSLLVTGSVKGELMVDADHPHALLPGIYSGRCPAA